ncbi:thioredoxin family protein [Imperialibacter roseus]|uniref:Thioredoxin family protein n=1 Tax=Imperialibacter roseus TaxID=1324217 RepID=A0ABZ0IRW6_9BACT|nr:thioredoxin family protein [Imperialibacter roseus]WOK07242.1 thioredoxin family protein [Imperialibacter roseus]
MKRNVEIFTANCPVCDPVVQMVKELACDQCEITIYDLIKLCDDKVCLSKLEEYQIKKVPAIAVNGKLLNCCQDQNISKEELIKAGIGQG